MQPTYYQTTPGQHIYGKSPNVGGFLKKGCLFIVGGIFLLIVIILLGIFVLYPALTPNKIRGDFQEMAYIPTTQKLFIRTDGAFKYIQETSSPGYHSVGTEGIFCKTYTYLYDPVEQKVIKEIKKERDDISVKPEIYHNEGKVWIASQEMSEVEPEITVYNSETGDELMDTKGFIKKYPEQLGEGLQSLRFEDDPYAYVIKTKDGKEFVYMVNKDTLVGSYLEYREIMTALLKGIEAVDMRLGQESSGNKERQKLYKLKGPKDRISGVSDSQLYNKDYLTNGYQTQVEELTPGKVYLEGIVIGKNENGIVILHQDKLGKNVSRMITFVDINGKAWTVRQEELFGEDMGGSEDDPFSEIFFMKSKFKAEVSKDIVVFKFESEGIIGFDINTGKEKWRLDI